MSFLNNSIFVNTSCHLNSFSSSEVLNFPPSFPFDPHPPGGGLFLTSSMNSHIFSLIIVPDFNLSFLKGYFASDWLFQLVGNSDKTIEASALQNKESLLKSCDVKLSPFIEAFSQPPIEVYFAQPGAVNEEFNEQGRDLTQLFRNSIEEGIREGIPLEDLETRIDLVSQIGLNLQDVFVDANGVSLAHIAASAGNVPILTYFQGLGLNLNLETNNDLEERVSMATPLDYAAYFGQLEAFVYLNRFFPFSEREDLGANFFNLAIWSDHANIAAYMLDQGYSLDLSIRDPIRGSSFVMAASMGAEDVIDIFLENLDDFGLSEEILRSHDPAINPLMSENPFINPIVASLNNDQISILKQLTLFASAMGLPLDQIFREFLSPTLPGEGEFDSIQILNWVLSMDPDVSTSSEGESNSDSD
ncbi:MAG: hypothetical protein S4CHLAM7_04970 [Chlamydiae bacterium]|nr:hypothetical protein [Chlamydiota bacterium]